MNNVIHLNNTNQQKIIGTDPIDQKVSVVKKHGFLLISSFRLIQQTKSKGHSKINFVNVILYESQLV